jgi:hypothetical protein
VGSAIVSGLIGGLVGTAFLGWAMHNLRAVDANADGWRTIRAGVAIWAPLAGSAAFSLLLLYVYFFVGSARADAESQMMACLGVALAFALGAAALAASAFGQSVSWRAGELRVCPLIGATTLKPLSELASIQLRSWSHMFRLTFSDGYAVELSPYMHGTKQLLDHIGYPPEGSAR